MSLNQDNRPHQQPAFNLDYFFSLDMVLIAVISPEGLLLKINKAWETVLCYPQEQLLDKPFIQLIHPDDVAATLSHMSRLNKLEDVVGYVNRYRCQNGSYRHMEWNAQMREGYIYAIARDVTDRVTDKQLLQAEHERFELAIWGSNDGIWDWDLVAGTVYLSPRWKAQLGYTDQDLANDPERFVSLLHPDDRDRVLQLITDYLQRRIDTYDTEFRMRHKDGHYRWIQARGKAFWTEAGQAYRMAGAHTDITTRKKMEEDLRVSESKYRLMAENVTDVIWILNINQMRYTYISPSILRLRGLTVEEALAESLEDSLLPESLARVSAAMQVNLPRFIADPAIDISNVTAVQQPCKDGRIIWVEVSTRFQLNDRAEIEVLGVSRNIEDRKRQERQIELLSFHDQLTGLYNRHYFEKTIAEWSLAPQRSDGIALIVADVNGLKLANDAFGHAMGDRLLLAVASALRKVARPRDLVARLGGDEFVLFMPETSKAKAEQVLKDLGDACLDEKIDFLDLSVSLGLASIHTDAMTIQEAYKLAEQAMYDQKMIEGERYRNDMVRHMIDQILTADPVEKAHADRVTQICLRLGKVLGLPDSQLAALVLAGQLHDIGKVGLDHDQTGWQEHAQGLDSDEMKKHVQIGYYILHSASQYSHIAEAVLAHHERFDGLGYPKGLQGQAIPLLARIVKIANDYEILVRNGLPMQAAVAQIIGQSGQAFDPALVNPFVEQAVIFDGATRPRQAAAWPLIPVAAEIDQAPDPESQGLSDQVAWMMVNHQLDETLASLVTNREFFEAFYQYHKKSEAALAPFKHVFELANYGLSINELDGTTLYINPYFARIHGYEPEELVGQKLNLFHTPRQLVQVSRLIQKIIEAGGFQAEEVWHVDRWGQEFPMLMTGTYMEGDMERGQKPYMAATSIDIREIKAKEAEILYLNQHDPLTGLMNRNALNQLTVQDHHGDGNLVQSVLFINIDKFKLVNDVLGHQAGDNLLVQLADRIVALVGDQERVYRIGGDVFLILVPSLDLDELSALAKSIQQLIGRQIDIHQSAVLITASQGICIGKPGLSLEQTITRAETALNQAKKKRNAIAVYHDSMERARTRDVLLELDLQSALEQNQFELFYQPIFNVHTGRIDQAEALLRWNHPVFGRIPPLDFIPIAERTRLIIPITDWVIRQACSKITEWSELGLEGLMVSVNLSILSIENRGEELVDFIGSAIRASGISPSRLKLEITESTLANDLDEIISVFQKLKQLGVKLALDDFGTGYSSFGYMKDLPLDIMKLDWSLIGNIAVSEKEQMIVGSMVTIIHGLGLEVVIEGVETKEQLDSIMKFDCDYIQGYYFSKPLPPDEFVRYFFSVTEEFREAFLSTYPALHSQVHLDWQEDWASGNPQLDRQHQDLMQDANRLLHLALDGTDQARLIQELDVLLRHVTDHFSYEEEVMGTSGYPDLLAHRREHERLVQEIHQLRQRYTQKQVRPTVFFSFLVDQVILGHLVDEDAKYFRWTRPPA